MFRFLLFLLLPGLALAGSPRYHPHYFSDISAAACPSGTPGLDSDGVEYGISLSGLRGWKVVICADTGRTISATGSLKVCTYSQTLWGPALWAEAPEFTWSMSSVGGAGTRCISLSDREVSVGLSDRIFVYPSMDFGVSSGGLTVYLYGELR